MQTSHEILAELAQAGEPVLLSFSGGKDSLAAWCKLVEYGIEVVPLYKYLIPNLQFVERSLTYYEQHFGTHIYRVAHPNAYHWLRTMALQPPERLPVMQELALPRFTYLDVSHGVALTHGLPWPTWTVVGVRSYDSATRRKAVATKGAWDTETWTVWAIHDLSKQDIIDTLRRHGVKLPRDYAWFGRSWDNVSYQYVAAIKKYAPEDYERIKLYYPLVDLELARAELARRHGYAK